MSRPNFDKLMLQELTKIRIMLDELTKRNWPIVLEMQKDPDKDDWGKFIYKDDIDLKIKGSNNESN